MILEDNEIKQVPRNSGENCQQTIKWRRGPLEIFTASQSGAGRRCRMHQTKPVPGSLGLVGIHQSIGIFTGLIPQRNYIIASIGIYIVILTLFIFISPQTSWPSGWRSGESVDDLGTKPPCRCRRRGGVVIVVNPADFSYDEDKVWDQSCFSSWRRQSFVKRQTQGWCRADKSTLSRNTFVRFNPAPVESESST